MPNPTPNGPTLADLQYGSYNQAGYVNVTQSIPGEFIGSNSAPGAPVNDSVATRENVILVVPGFTFSIDTSDFLNTAENAQGIPGPTGPNSVTLQVSDSVTTAESVVRA